MAEGIQKNFRIPPDVFRKWSEVNERIRARVPQLGEQDFAVGALMAYLDLPDDAARLNAIGRGMGFLAFDAAAGTRPAEAEPGVTREDERIVARADRAADRRDSRGKPRPRRPAG